MKKIFGLLNRIRGSIVAKINLSILLIIAVFGTLATVSVYHYSRRTIRFFVEEELRNISLSPAEKLSQRFNSTQQILNYLTNDENIKISLEDPDMIDTELVNNTLKSYIIDDRYLAVYLLNSDGLGVFSTDERFIGKDYSFRDYFLQAKEEGYGYESAIGVTSKELGYYFSRSVYSGSGYFLGVAVIKINPKNVEDIIGIKNFEKTFYLTDSCGIVILSNEQEYLYRPLNKLEDARLIVCGINTKYPGFTNIPINYEFDSESVVAGNVVLKKQFKDDKQMLVSYAKVGSFPFYLITEAEETVILNPSLKTSETVGFFVFVAALSANIIITLFVRRLLKPLKLLEKVSEEIGKGNFDQNIIIKGNDEISILSESLQKMSFRLKNIYEHLEELVEERTKDLNKFKLAVENASDSIVITDPEGIILYANKAVERITGFESTKVLGKKAGSSELWGGLMGKEFYQLLWKTIKNDKNIFSGEIKNRNKNGQEYIAFASVAPVLDENQKVIFFVGIERDVSAEKNLEKMKDDFMSMASHQLRTPLGAMRWNLEMLLGGDSGKLDKESKKTIADVYQSNLRLLELVRNLLDISRIEQRRVSDEPVKVNVKNVLSEIISELKPLSENRNISISLNVEKTSPELFIDVKMFREVMSNLISNAIKYNKKNGKVEIRIYVKDNKIVFSISDTGVGIPTKDQRNIFDKFFRAENAAKSETEGTGLGLYVAKSYVDSWGGSITFKSVEGKGTKFEIKIPSKPKVHMLDRNLEKHPHQNA